MATKKDNLPLSLEQEGESTGTITYASEVIAIISGVAANEVEGIAGMCTSGGISDVFGRNKNITKGVRVELGTEEASVDLYVVVEYGTPIQTAALNVQENVRKAIETMTGLHVVRVDVHVQGVSFEKENKETLAGLESASLDGYEFLPEQKEEEIKPVKKTSRKKPVPKVKKAKEAKMEEPAAPVTEEEPAAEAAAVETVEK